MLGDVLDSTWQEQLAAFGQEPDRLPQLLHLASRRAHQFSQLNLATALHRIALLGGNTLQEHCDAIIGRIDDILETKPESFRAQSLANIGWAIAKLSWQCPRILVNLTTACVGNLTRFKSSELSMLLWSLASSPGAPTDAQQSMLKGITSEFRRRGPAALDAQSIATIAYASATLTLDPEDEFWPVVSAGSERRVDEFSDRQLANLVWAFATVVHSDSAETLFARTEEAHIGDLAPIDLSLVAWAMAKVGHGTPQFYQAVADAVVEKKPAWKVSDARNIATLVYALALAEQAVPNEHAFRILADAADIRLCDFMVQGLTNLVWGYATAAFTEQRWFTGVGDELLRRDTREFEPLDVANCLWAFAAVMCPQTPAISRLKDIGSDILTEFTGQNLAISMWSFATLFVRDGPWFERAADCFLLQLSESKSQELNNTLWACATAGVRLPWLFIKVSDYAVSHIGLSEFKMHELSIMMWAHGTAGVCNHPFFDAIIDDALDRRGISECAPREIANMTWAYSTIIGRSNPRWFNAVASYSVNHMCEFDMQGIGNVVWAFANVGVIDAPLFTSASDETANRCTNALVEHFSAGMDVHSHQEGPVAAVVHNVSQVLAAMHAAGIDNMRLLEAATRAFLLEGSDSSARELLILANAVQSSRIRGCQSTEWMVQLDARLWDQVLQPLFVAASRPQLGGEFGSFASALRVWEALAAVVARLDIEHLGVHFTARFLKETGLAPQVSVIGSARYDASTPAWAERAAAVCAEERGRVASEAIGTQSAKLARQLEKVNKRDIAACISYDVQVIVASGKVDLCEKNQFFSWREDLEDDCTRHVACLHPISTTSRVSAALSGDHDRSGHAERGALLEVVERWSQYSEGTDLPSVTGNMQIYVTHFPCISCLGVLAQFSRIFPRVVLTVSFADGRVALCQPQPCL